MKIEEREQERRKSSLSSSHADRSEADMDDFMNDADHPLNRYSETSSRPSASGEISMSNTLQNYLGIDERESKVFMEKQKIVSDMKNVVDSESAFILGRMSEKYLDNLYQLNMEEELRKTHQLNISNTSHAEETRKLKKIEMEVEIDHFRKAMKRAQIRNDPLSRHMSRDEMTKVIFNHAERLELEEIDYLAKMIVTS